MQVQQSLVHTGWRLSVYFTHHICSNTPRIVLPGLSSTAGVEVCVCMWRGDLLAQDGQVLLSIFATRRKAVRGELNNLLCTFSAALLYCMDICSCDILAIAA